MVVGGDMNSQETKKKKFIDPGLRPPWKFTIGNFTNVIEINKLLLKFNNDLMKINLIFYDFVYIIYNSLKRMV